MLYFSFNSSIWIQGNWQKWVLWWNAKNLENKCFPYYLFFFFKRGWVGRAKFFIHKNFLPTDSKKYIFSSLLAEAKRQLLASGFILLNENENWDLKPGGRYFFTRNMSCLIAFAVGEKWVMFLQIKFYMWYENNKIPILSFSELNLSSLDLIAGWPWAMMECNVPSGWVFVSWSELWIRLLVRVVTSCCMRIRCLISKTKGYVPVSGQINLPRPNHYVFLFFRFRVITSLMRSFITAISWISEKLFFFLFVPQQSLLRLPQKKNLFPKISINLGILIFGYEVTRSF